MAGVRKNLMVRVGADFSAVTTQSKKAADSMEKMQSRVTRSCSVMQKAVGALKKAFTFTAVAYAAKSVINIAKEWAAAYDAQMEAELKLATAMRNTMGARNDEIQSVLDLASAQQKLGVIGDEVQLAGAQELATYLSTSSALKRLIPVMNDMAAQQYGYNVTAEETTSIATMLGKVMNGQVSALSRYGYTFDEAQEKILKFGTEEQRAATLARVVEQSVGGMNRALAQTPTGRMKQLSNTWGDLKEKFGQAVRSIGVLFLPLLEKVADVLAAIATLANRVAQSFVNVFGGGAKAAGSEWSYLPTGATEIPDYDDEASDYSEIGDYADQSADSLDNMASSAANAKKKLEELQQLDFDTLHILREPEEEEDEEEARTPQNTASPASPASSRIRRTALDEDGEPGEGIEWLEKFLEKLKGLKDALQDLRDLWQRIKDTLIKSRDDIQAAFSAVPVWIAEHVFEPLRAGAEALSGALRQALGSAKDWVCSAWAPVPAWFEQHVYEPMRESAEALSGALRQALGSAGELACASWAPVPAWFEQHVYEPMRESAEALSGALRQALGNAKDWACSAWAPVPAWFSENVFQPLLERAAEQSGVLGQALTGDLDGIYSAWAPVPAWFSQNIFQQISQSASALTSALSQEAPGLRDRIYAAWESAPAWFNQHVLQPGYQNALSFADAVSRRASGLRDQIYAAWETAPAWFNQHVLQPGYQNALSFADAVSRCASGLRDRIYAAWESAPAWFNQHVFQPVTQRAEAAGNLIRTTSNVVGTEVATKWNQVSAQLAERLDYMRSTAERTWMGIRTTGAVAAEMTRSAFANAWSGVTQIWQSAGAWFSSSVFSPIAAGAADMANNVLGFFGEMASRAADIINGIGGWLGDLASRANELFNAISSFDLSSIDWGQIAVDLPGYLGGSGLLGGLAGLSGLAIPGLAEGAVIPPNRKFAAILGDQTSGTNIETPERLLRQIVRTEMAPLRDMRASAGETISAAARDGSSDGLLLRAMDEILDAVLAGHDIVLDDMKVAKAYRRIGKEQSRIAGAARA